MQLLKYLNTLLLCALGTLALPTGHNADSTLTAREGKAVNPVKPGADPAAELAYWNSQPGVPSVGMAVGLYIFEGVKPRDKSVDSTLPKLVVDGMNAAQANHHTLIGVIVSLQVSGPPKKRITTLGVSSVVAWDIAVQKDTDKMIAGRYAGSTWKRTLATKVQYKYVGKAKSGYAAAVNTIGKTMNSEILFVTLTLAQT